MHVFPYTQRYHELGHSYGGILKSRAEIAAHLPGEWLPLNSYESDLLRDSSGRPFYEIDPYQIQGLDSLIHSGLSAPFQPEVTLYDAGPNKIPCPDIFAKLPLELRQMIFQLLPSPCVLRFKLASSVAAYSQLSGTFWASRFAEGFEFEHIFEVKAAIPIHTTRNWKQLYLNMCSMQDNPAIVNRARIFKLAKSLAHLKSVASNTICYGTPNQSLLEPHVSSTVKGDYQLENESSGPSTQWRTASRALVPIEKRFNSGCRALRSRTITLRSPIVSVDI
jgi:hypothetical protein